MKANFILALLALAMSTFTACEINNNCITGSGDYSSRNYSIADFDALSINGIADVYITKDSATTLRIEAQENVLNTLDVKVENNRLIIGDDECFKQIKTIKVYASTPALKALYSSGNCNIYSQDLFKSPVFKIDFSGMGSMDFNIETDELNCFISGDIDAKINGQATKQNYDISGKAEFECFELVGEYGDISISDEAELEVNTSTKLDVEISGKGSIYYKGNPEIKRNISGSGTIVKVE